MGMFMFPVLINELDCIETTDCENTILSSDQTHYIVFTFITSDLSINSILIHAGLAIVMKSAYKWIIVIENRNAGASAS